MFLRLGLERFTNLTQRKTNVGKQQTTHGIHAMVIEILACFCPGFPNYWLLISWRIACNWSYPSSFLLLTRVMQDAWWSAERKGKRKREELRSHARANRSGRITHDFKSIWCLVDMDECSQMSQVRSRYGVVFVSLFVLQVAHLQLPSILRQIYVNMTRISYDETIFQQLRPNLSKPYVLFLHCPVFTSIVLKDHEILRWHPWTRQRLEERRRIRRRWPTTTAGTQLCVPRT